MAGTITYADFERVDTRVGTIINAQSIPEARKPAIEVIIDSGSEIGVKRSPTRLTVHYLADRLLGRQLCAAVNFTPRRIGQFVSDVLTLGMPVAYWALVLIAPAFKAPNGGEVF